MNIPHDLESVLVRRNHHSAAGSDCRDAWVSARCDSTPETITRKETPYPQELEIRDGQVAMHWGADPFWREMTMIDGDTFFPACRIRTNSF